MLERAILDAALEQLSTVGWSGLTMEGVAAGAQTGKAAVYRRWPSKEDLRRTRCRPDCHALIRHPISAASVRICSRCAGTPGTRCSPAPVSRFAR